MILSRALVNVANKKRSEFSFISSQVTFVLLFDHIVPAFVRVFSHDKQIKSFEPFTIIECAREGTPFMRHLSFGVCFVSKVNPIVNQ